MLFLELCYEAEWRDSAFGKFTSGCQKNYNFLAIIGEVVVGRHLWLFRNSRGATYLSLSLREESLVCEARDSREGMTNKGLFPREFLKSHISTFSGLG